MRITKAFHRLLGDFKLRLPQPLLLQSSSTQYAPSVLANSILPVMLISTWIHHKSLSKLNPPHQRLELLLPQDRHFLRHKSQAPLNKRETILNSRRRRLNKRVHIILKSLVGSLERPGRQHMGTAPFLPHKAQDYVSLILSYLRKTLTAII